MFRRVPGKPMTISNTALVALSQAREQLDRAAEGIQRATNPDPEIVDRVDLSEEIVNLLTARTAFRSAIELAKTSDEIAEESLDLLA